MYTTDQEVESFLNEYKRSRVIIESTVRAVINRALEFENKFQKAFYNFTKEEALVMFKSAHAISNRSLQNANLVLRHFTRWIVDSKKIHVLGSYEMIEKSDLDTCVDENKKKELILNKEDLKEIQSELLNYTDKAILELLYIGVGGKWLKELTFLTMQQVSLQLGTIYFRNGKMIPIDADTYELIKNACAETELISFGDEARIARVTSKGIFKVRHNALSESDDEHDEVCLERRFRWVQRRLKLIGDNMGVRLTSGSIQSSGLLHMIKEGIEISSMTFRDYVKTDECREFAKRFDITSELAPQILIEKFEEYFV